MAGGQGGRWGGAPESSVGATKGARAPTGLIWLGRGEVAGKGGDGGGNWSDLAGDEGGGMGGGVGRWPMEGGQGGRWGGGGTR